jgi:dihydrodipicolinate synthase/N-acetylneuraminate lyase
MRLLVFLHGTTIMHAAGVGVSREQRVEQALDEEPSVRLFEDYVPIGKAPQKLRAWAEQGAEITYLSPHRNIENVRKDEDVLRRYEFPSGDIDFRRDRERYADVVERIGADLLIEDDCESIGGAAKMSSTELAARGARVPTIVVREFEGIDELPDDLAGLRGPTPLGGALAAAVTPLRDGGEALDEDAFTPYADFLAAGGLDGLLALGTTGEGMLLPQEQRLRAAQLYVESARGRLAVAVHAGAQSTRDTVELAAHAADVGADAVAVIGPPYFALDDSELLAHFFAAARACEPTPFYVYEFAARSGYAVPPHVLERLREAAPNFRGLKVSETPWARFAPYLVEGLDVFVGPEALIGEGMAAGAVGAVSALASAFPELVVAAVREPASADLGPVRETMQKFPFQSALKTVLARRGVPINPDVRRPLRMLTDTERWELERWLESSLPAPAR